MVSKTNKIDQLKEIRKALEGIVQEIRLESVAVHSDQQLKELGSQFNEAAGTLANIWHQIVDLVEQMPHNSSFETGKDQIQSLPFAVWDEQLTVFRIESSQQKS